MEKAHRYRNERGFTRKPYLAIHLRHGNDWVLYLFIDIDIDIDFDFDIDFNGIIITQIDSSM